jgi:hypothetical protein
VATRKQAGEGVYWGPPGGGSPVPTHRLIVIGLFIAFLLVVVVDYYRKRK